MNDRSRFQSISLGEYECKAAKSRFFSFGPAHSRKKSKSKICKLRLFLNLLAAFNLIIFVMGTAFATMPYPPNNKVHKMERIKYFISHSFEFTLIFNRYHQSPGWMLRHQKQLKLTHQQIAEEKRFKRGMQKSTAHDVTSLKKAYRTYAADGAQTDPSISLIKKDIALVGQKETMLALEMVPYHLQAYKILNSTQRKTYSEIEKRFIDSLQLSMYKTPFGNAN